MRDLLRCRSGVEGWVPKELGVRSAADFDKWVAGVASAEPAVLPSLLEADDVGGEGFAHAEGGPESKQPYSRPGVPPTLSEGSGDEGDDGVSGGEEDEWHAGAEASNIITGVVGDGASQDGDGQGEGWVVNQVDAATSAGPSREREPMAHLWFGWSWAMGGLVKAVTGMHIRDALRSECTHWPRVCCLVLVPPALCARRLPPCLLLLLTSSSSLWLMPWSVWSPAAKLGEALDVGDEMYFGFPARAKDADAEDTTRAQVEPGSRDDVLPMRTASLQLGTADAGDGRTLRWWWGTARCMGVATPSPCLCM